MTYQSRTDQIVNSLAYFISGVLVSSLLWTLSLEKSETFFVEEISVREGIITSLQETIQEKEEAIEYYTNRPNSSYEYVPVVR